MTIEEAEALPEMSGAMSEGSGRKPREYGAGAANVTACSESSWTEVATRLMEEVVSRGNVMAAYQRVVRNKGAAGIDGMPVGVLEGGIVSPRVEGTPQGGPLSPLLSNILLDEFDKELERRNHAFCRYAADCNIYVQSRRAAERVMTSLTQFLEQQLKLNRVKSAVGRPWERTFLGYSMTFHKKPRLKVTEASVKRLKAGLREIFRRGRGRRLKRVIEESTPKLRGWIAYFRLAEVKGIFEDFDGWIRGKLRCIMWRQWKRPFTRARNLMRRGLTERRAWRSATNERGPWWNSGASHMNDAFRKSFFDKLGLVSLVDRLRRFQRAL
ncbi:MAG: RNA-directed polymerase [Desulfuromonadales bacterium]|jgi:hypothetical protein|nr:RNA-directed polymerase [Desulfuromonadales bacterium]